MRLTITLDLGNEAMQDSNDVAAVVHEVASQLLDRNLTSKTNVGTRWSVSDANGNRVGTWAVTRTR